jgi:hypothetical protein
MPDADLIAVLKSKIAESREISVDGLQARDHDLRSVMEAYKYLDSLEDDAFLGTGRLPFSARRIQHPGTRQ